jgi:RNA polymerase sigma-70 factor (sigma-E family)
MFAARARPTRRLAYLLCGDWAEAEDLTQTAFTKLYARWGSLRDAAAVDAYLRRTVTRAYIDARRRRWRREEPTATLPERAAHDVDVDNRVVLLAALAGLPPRQRACVVLRYYDDCSVEATAVALRCSPGTVKSNTSRGLDALRAVLGDAPDLVSAKEDNR